MAEIKDLQIDIKKINELIVANKIGATVTELLGMEKAVKEIKSKLNEVNEKFELEKQTKVESVIETKKEETPAKPVEVVVESKKAEDAF